MGVEYCAVDAAEESGRRVSAVKILAVRPHLHAAAAHAVQKTQGLVLDSHDDCHEIIYDDKRSEASSEELTASFTRLMLENTTVKFAITYHEKKVKIRNETSVFEHLKRFR